MNDSQFGIARLLRPFAGFEDAYQGESVVLPIMFTEGGVALDSQAGQTGYSPLLLKGLSVPFGARITVMLPVISGATGLAGTVARYPYRWEFTWRMRNVFDHRQERIPFHLRKQGAGVPDAGSARVVLPAAAQTVVYPESPEPAAGGASGPFNVARTNLRTERTRTELSSWSRPYIDSGGVTQGVYQQGLFDPAIDPTLAHTPIFGGYDMYALGDELLVGVTRDSDSVSGSGAANATWGFDAGEADRNFSRLFGDGSGSTFLDLGIYVLMGTAP